MATIKCGFMKKTEGGFFSSDTYHCTKIDSDVPYEVYDKYCTEYAYDECPNYKYEEPSSGCFITTIVCDIIGLEDRNIYLMLLRKFRNNYLQKNQNGIKILEQYDFIGPIISKKIFEDQNKQQLARQLFLNNLVPVFDEITKDNYEEAIKIYTNMVNQLIEKYNLNTLALTLPIDNYDYRKDYSLYGHGRKK